MRQFLTIACIILFLSSCSQRSKRDRTLSDFIPENSAIIFKTNSLETLESDIKNNGLINIISSKNLFEDFKSEFKKFDSLKLKNESLICISGDHDISIISTINEALIENDSLQKVEETFYNKTIDSFIIKSFFHFLQRIIFY